MSRQYIAEDRGFFDAQKQLRELLIQRPEVCERVRQALLQGFPLIRFEVQWAAATGADQLFLYEHPSHQLERLLVALRTGNRELDDVLQLASDARR